MDDLTKKATICMHDRLDRQSNPAANGKTRYICATCTASVVVWPVGQT